MIDLTQWEGYPHYPKLWGEEIWITNNPLYCAKLLVIQPGYRCSLHSHTIKDETFIVLEGRMAIEWGTDLSQLRVESKDVGDSLRMHPSTYHRFWCPKPIRAVVLEVSTTHSDSDVSRVVESGPFEEVL